MKSSKLKITLTYVSLGIRGTIAMETRITKNPINTSESLYNEMKTLKLHVCNHYTLTIVEELLQK